MASAEGDLSGRRVLVVEDESLVTMLIQDTLAEMACELIGVASRYTDAIEMAKSLSFDVAIVDVNLNGQTSFAIADSLAERGVPFVFATGYDKETLPAQFRAVPIVQKPFQKRHLERALRAVLTNPKGGKPRFHLLIDDPQDLTPNGSGARLGTARTGRDSGELRPYVLARANSERIESRGIPESAWL
jgi:CheY-like chemotaxis protein